MVDVNTPVTNPELVAALDALREGGSEARWDAFRAAVRAAHLLVPVAIEPGLEVHDGVATTPPAGTTLSFEAIQDTEGHPYLPVFTDWPALRAWRDRANEQTWICTFDDVVTITRGHEGSGFVINPETHALPVAGDLLRWLAAVPVARVAMPEGTTVQLGEPATEPVALKAAIASYLRTQPTVSGAWLVLMHNAGTYSFLVAVAFTGDQRALFDGIARAAHPALGSGELLDLVPADTDLGGRVAAGHLPFYLPGT